MTLTFLPKPEKKPKNADKTDDIKRHEELHSPWTQDNTTEVKRHDETHSPWTQDITATEKDPLTVTKPDAPTESTSRKKSRWKMSVPDMKHHKRTPRPPNPEKKPTLGEANEHESASAPLPSSDDPAHNGSSDSILDHSKEVKADKRKMKLSADDNSTVESEREIRTNVLSPLRRPKLDPEDTFPIAAAVLRDPYLAPQRIPQLDVPPAHQPEVHLIGEIVRGHGFGSSGGLTCKWRVEYGSLWHHIAGDQLGQTQIDYPSTAPWTSDPDVAVWSHPIDLHFATSAFQGWPKLLFQVWRVDSSMTSHVVGYGFVPVPFAAGQHELWVSLWRPMGSAKEEMQAQLLGRTPELTSDDALFSAAWSERCRLRTISTGKVLIHISVLRRNFQSGVIAA
ncbi:hypothetical protein BBJ28_00005377 [Nothophytophthora sp. Chile5]|nr:hypothetical protein BBJ28_00005377 [Nothophytophthora sp. Chile5]